MKLTDWFVNGEKPVREGVYEVKSLMLGGPVYSYWDGERWGCATLNKVEAYEFRTYATPRLHLDVKWRGLAEEPKP